MVTALVELVPGAALVFARALALAAEQAPHCNGAQAGWYWLEARSADGAQVQVSHQAHAGWQSAWQAVASWLGWQD